MRLLHSADWHLGRSLYGHDLGAAQSAYVDHLVEVVRAEAIDVVMVSGDVHDRALPPVSAMQLFDEALRRVRDAGASVMVISGNHDAPARLGDKAGLLDPRIVLRTDPRRVGEPFVVQDSHGPVALYGLPYLEPAAVRELLPAGPNDLTSDDDPVERGAHARVLRRAMNAVHEDRAVRGGRSVVLAHAWVSGGKVSDSERDITVGGIGDAPAAIFDGIDYVALGHLHRPQTLREHLRYSGSPLPYSFSEAGQVKSSWLVELDAGGLGRVEQVPAPLHRRLTALVGTLEDLLTSTAHTAAEQDFVALTMTDAVRPVEAMAALQRRFAFPLTLSWQPSCLPAGDGATYAQRTRGRTDVEVAEAFVRHVRDEPSESEQALMRAALEAARLDEDAAVGSGR